MKITNLLILLLLPMPSCVLPNHSSRNMTITFRNSTKRGLDWVKMETPRGAFSVGVLGPTYFKSNSYYTWKNPPEKAVIKFVDEKTRQKYTVTCSLTEANEKIKSGKCKEIIFDILATDKVQAVCE